MSQQVNKSFHIPFLCIWLAVFVGYQLNPDFFHEIERQWPKLAHKSLKTQVLHNEQTRTK
jgi:hypothetical protein